MDDRPGFAHLLRHHREIAGLTQEELAERAGLSARAVSDLERGERLRPHLTTVRLLAAALALSPADVTAMIDASHRHMGPPTGASGAAPAAPAGDVGPRGNLPSPLTSFVGRERDVIAVTGVLATARLTTLTGPGGCGKTRLAIRVAAELVDSFPDGAWLVDLEPLSDPAVVAQAVLLAFRLREPRGQSPAAALVAHLSTKHLLLVVGQSNLPGRGQS